MSSPKGDLSAPLYHEPEDEMSYGQDLLVDPEKDDALQLLLAFGPAFAREKRFWKSFVYSFLLGGVMGGMALLFFNGFNLLFDFWTGYSDYEDKLEAGTLEPYTGDWWWLGVTTLGGFVIGLVRLHPSMPEKVDGLFREVRDLHVDPAESPLIFLVSCLSLGIGASVGPEAAMGNMGGALGTLLGEVRDQSDRRKAISAFAGMAGAMGALFPSPVLSALLIHELSVTSRPGDPRFNAAVTTPLASFVEGAENPTFAQHDYMEQTCLAGAAACAGFAVFYGLAEYTYLDPAAPAVALYQFSEYHEWHLLAAIPLGIFAGLIGIVILVLLGIFRKVAKRIKERFASRGFRPAVATVFLPTLAGLILGLISVTWPLSMGDGAAQIPYVIKHGYSGEWIRFNNTDQPSPYIPEYYNVTPKISLGNLIGTLFGKVLSMAVCLGFGMVGGNIFPCIYAGTCAGLIVTRAFPDVPLSLAVPCMMSAVPASFAPIPFSLVGLVALVLVIDGKMAAPIFIATFVSFMTNCGFGVVQGVLERPYTDLKGVMTQPRNNNTHSFVGGEVGGGRGTGHGKRGGKGGGMAESSALMDVSEIIFKDEPGEKISDM